MSKMLIGFLSFMLGGAIGMILMSCIVISREIETKKENKKDCKK